jgi:hypothetical protein
MMRDSRAGRIVRGASGPGFWGDDLEAPVRQVEGGRIDYLMLDYLAEVTMSILRKQRERDPAAGYARDFVALMEKIFPACVGKGIRVVTNAGGVNPRGCAEALIAAAKRVGVRGKVALVTGDDLMDRLDPLIAAGHAFANLETEEPLSAVRDRVRSANAYLGARPIVEALALQPHVVVTGRASDAALTYAPMVHEFGWLWNDWDRLAAGVVAGHINECGAQSTGGNSMADWWTIPDLAQVGFPIIEAEPDGDFVVTKHQGSGGRVDRRTVTEQLVYEVGDPARYITPHVVADFTSLRLADDGPDRVRVTGVKGGHAPDHLKVSIAYTNGWKAVGTLLYTWPDAAAKARAAARVLRERLDRLGLRFDAIRTELVGWDAAHGHLVGEPPADLPEVQLRVAVRSLDPAPVERFTREMVPLVLTGPPSATGYAGARAKVQEIMAYWPALIPRGIVESGLRVDLLEA